MSIIPGAIPVTGFLGPTDSSDTYAVTDAIYGIDGFRSVSASTVRNAISTERRREGMLVYTQDDGNVWQLLPSPWVGTSADWRMFISSAATSSLTANTTSSNGLTKTGNNITLGGALTGNTYIDNAGFLFRANEFSATTISAQTIHVSNISGFSPLNFPIFIVNPVSPVDGDIWILSGATGNALLSIRIGGLTKTVELS